jgi:membrane-bound lytic murein transglycosylase A
MMNASMSDGKPFLMPLSVFGLLLLFAGCESIVKKPADVEPQALVRVAPSEYPRFTDDMDFDGLAHSLMQSLAYLKRVPPGRKFRYENDVFDTAHMTRSLDRFLAFIQKNRSKKDLEMFIRTHYLVYRSIGSPGGDAADSKGRVLFTGYYEPILSGSPEKGPDYRYPIYTRPSDLLTIDLSRFSDRFKGEKLIGRTAGQTVVPYYDRRDIDRDNHFPGKAPPLAWLKDPVDLFFLHIQGSGKVYLESGKMINVHYHTTNGRPYRSIGKLLIDEGKIPRSQMSMQRIRAYLRDHPGEVERILHHNPSYVFFKIEDDGPLGSLGVKLSPGRSIALDRRLFPRAGLAFVRCKKPLIDGSGNIHTWIDMNRFVLNHDTGGAIRGPGRADLFCGSGKYAKIAAGHMKHRGDLFFLILKPENP